ncbi:MAG: phosphopantetheine-binding protein [Candidatus Omnitrophica bacterium]|nr:phosphopantetheine-binding protein [Candidatus Omnitrophota bacterium]
MSDKINDDFKQLLSSVTGVNPDQIGDTADLIKDVGIDSLKVIEIATNIEKKYKITIKDTQLRKLKRVSDAVKLIRNSLKKNEKQ